MLRRGNLTPTRRESIHGGSKASSLMPTVGPQVIPAGPFSRAWHKHLFCITLAQAIDQLMRGEEQ